MRVVVMGVSGCGKSTLGADLAQLLGGRFIEGDALHPEANRAKMAAGIPLTDEDRWPWLDRVAGVLASEEPPVIAACSALKRAYRDRLRAGAGPLTFLWMDGSYELIVGRMALRKGHYMPTSLLQSQFEALEPPGPGEAVRLDISEGREALLAEALRQLGQ
ncbi:gluconokinase [Pseudoroseicyclus tamaricis]|uniref:Gluconokinase n=1 Tax=Pseudoroseicyclus tamaricis TaxID=2705421 RepID=A0A6B2JLE8_9RHOB|nr:gluconokinase [Pseudoroseicyclus tamaricis]NDV02381.1 gluconokinase [Pseudoroseicyclus tamaricis]